MSTNFNRSGQRNNSSDLAGVINEEFLYAHSSRQRSILHNATGDKRFLTMPEQELHRYIESAINQIEAQQRSAASGNTAGMGVPPHFSARSSGVQRYGNLCGGGQPPSPQEIAMRYKGGARRPRRRVNA